MVNSQTIRFDLFGLKGYRFAEFPVYHRIFGRKGGISAPPYDSFNTAHKTADPLAEKNRQRLRKVCAIENHPLAVMSPCHGTGIRFLGRNDFHQSEPVLVSKADAVFTDVPGAYLLASFADCVNILMTDSAGSFAGLVHLGWRNVVGGFLNTVIEAVAERFRILPETMVSGIGPCIYPCCYVYENPVQRDDPFWSPYLRKREGEAYSIDLVSAVKKQLADSGVIAGGIFEMNICTACNNEEFFSCYKEGYISGRFPVLIGNTLS
jgi:hypothetical protein